MLTATTSTNKSSIRISSSSSSPSSSLFSLTSLAGQQAGTAAINTCTMRSWIARFVSILVVVIWVYSSLALSSASLWSVGRRYLDLKTTTPTTKSSSSSPSLSSSAAAATTTTTTMMTHRGSDVDKENDDNDSDDHDNDILANRNLLSRKNLTIDTASAGVTTAYPWIRQSRQKLSQPRRQRQPTLLQRQRRRRRQSVTYNRTLATMKSLRRVVSRSMWNRFSSRIRQDKRRYQQQQKQQKRRQKRKLFVSNRTLHARQQSFLDRIALVNAAFWYKETEALLENTTTALVTTLTRARRRSQRNKEDIQGAIVVTNNVTTTTPTTMINSNTEEPMDDSWITSQSDLTLPGRHITIVTTAALPWMTGTAVNPLLRAAHLCRRTRIINQRSDNNDTDPSNKKNNSHDNNYKYMTDLDDDDRQQPQQQQWVTVVLPWLELMEDQLEVYNQIFSNPQEQEDYIRNWLRNDAGLDDVADAETGLKILFYPARYHSGMRSVFAMGDICSLIPDEEADVCILEEPEHCNWFRAPGDGWTRKFHYVVGVVHTNYKEYVHSQYYGLWTAPAIAMISSAMVRAYCHKVIKLSDVLQTFAPEKEATSNVHGVRSDFLEEGVRRSQRALEQNDNRMQSSSSSPFTKRHVGLNGRDDCVVGKNNSNSINQINSNQNGVYFIGKLLWAKGFDLMLDLEDYYKQCTGEYFSIDIYGSGPDQAEITRAYLGRRKRRQQQEKKQARSSEATEMISTESRTTTTESLPNISDATITSEGRIARNLHLSSERDVVDDDDDDDDDDDKYDDDHSCDHESNDNDNKDQFNQSLNDSDDWDTSFFNLSSFNRESLSYRARKRLARITQRIRSTTESIEIPRTFHELRRQPVPAIFHGRVDHSALKESYKIFVNPSVSEVLCTTTAEALAMGKFAIIPIHPSNAFFYQFPNCLAYRNKFEFVANLRWALSHEPEPLTAELAREFSWEAATDRLIQAAAITWKEAREREKLGMTKLDERIAWLHNELGKGAKGDLLRKALGGGPVSQQVKYQNKVQREQRQEQEIQQELLLLELENLNQGHSREVGQISDKSVGNGSVNVDNEEDDDDDDNEGLTQKFRRSTFVRAIRSTIANGFPSWSAS